MNLIEAIYEHGVFKPIGNPIIAEGQRVKIILNWEKNEYAARAEKFRTLFELTQSLPELQNITEEEIAAEIAVYRLKK
jgi:predicted DNA-binding antitoxin AbrB/MazE fold protein